MIKMERIGDILQLLHTGNPKRITFDLSEDGAYYNAEIYVDIVDRSNGEEYEGRIQCKSSLNSISCYPLVYDREHEGMKIFTITIPDLDKSNILWGKEYA